ncbi:hypothetical protein ONS95_007043 [Cadophora gregata]|uniref:uncharacterized protein n=1 Tax=Cadophora gregata TaxID=51156 RepID=UPI0026DA82D1|nr:uncharacterized protein ONS95_007043 [Cadophora gregata]KAK0100585.1 hypothetical protein ONS95_007043 [Cadophora gregata]KAK0117416.1 hypothetical protein ONS96_013246 [Cadophora gregata f. sp. sojae]
MADSFIAFRCNLATIISSIGDRACFKEQTSRPGNTPNKTNSCQTRLNPRLVHNLSISILNSQIDFQNCTLPSTLFRMLPTTKSAPTLSTNTPTTSTTSTKRLWFSRQLNKLNTKLHRLHPKYNRTNNCEAEGPTRDTARTSSIGGSREVGINVLEHGHDKESEHKAEGIAQVVEEAEVKGKENMHPPDLARLQPHPPDLAPASASASDDENLQLQDFHKETAQKNGNPTNAPLSSSGGKTAGCCAISASKSTSILGSSLGAGTRTIDFAHPRQTMVPFTGGKGAEEDSDAVAGSTDGDFGAVVYGSAGGGRTIEGEITKNTALNSHPVAGLFREV